jgi:hypothetical protein
MGIVIGGLVLAAAFLVPFGLRVWARFHWFTAWLLGAMVLPALLWISETLQPSGWGWVVLMFWGIPAAALAAIGAGVGSLVLRKRVDHVAS